MRLVRTLLGVLACAGVLGAQSPAERFDRSYAELQQATAGDLRAAAEVASADFLRLPPGHDRRSRVAAGAWASFLAERHDLVLELTQQAREVAGGADVGQVVGADVGYFVELQLRALARLDVTRFVARLAADRDAHRTACDAALLAEAVHLLPAADRAMRQGQIEVGRSVFASLAAIEPPDAIRLANFALCLRHLGAWQESMSTYAQACELAPNDAQICNDHALCLRAAGHTAAALAMFRRSYELDSAVPGGKPGMGPAVTNLLHFEALRMQRPGAAPPAADDALAAANAALLLRPQAAMMRRLVLDVALDRLQNASAVQTGSRR